MPPTPSLTERLFHRLGLLPSPIVDTFSNIVFGRALAIGVRRGVFDTLEAVPATVEEIARATKLSVRGTSLLVESSCVAGYLSEHGGRYSLTSEARKWLLRDSPSYIGNLIRYFETLYERWMYLEQSLENGMPPRRYFETFTAEDWKVYVYAMRDLARLLLEDVIKKITLPGSANTLLDLGGSHGLYSIGCCRRYPSLTATIIDFESAVQFGERIVGELGMRDRVKLVAGDFTEMELPLHQDCVLMFNIVHGFTKDENRALLQRAINILKPGGKIYILDQLRAGKRRRGIAGFVPLTVGLNMLNEIGGNAYAYEQLQDWCKGVTSVRKISLRLPGIALVEVIR